MYPTQAAAREAQRTRLGAETVDRVLAYAADVARSPAGALHEAPRDLYEAIEAVLGCWPLPALDDDGTVTHWFLGHTLLVRAGGPREHLVLKGRVIIIGAA